MVQFRGHRKTAPNVNADKNGTMNLTTKESKSREEV